MSRPTKYDPTMCKTAEEFLAEGYTIRSCAAHLDIVHSTLYEWMAQHPEFSDAIKRGVDKSLKYLEDKLKKLIDGDKMNRPDTTALIFALKTRFHTVYGDKKDVVVTNDIKIHIDEDDSNL